MSRTIASALLVLLLAGLAAGCGGNQRIEYERDLAKVGKVVDDALAKLPQDESKTIGPEQVADLADTLREAADQLDDLDPPEDAKRPQARLAKGLRGIGAAFDQLATDLRAANTDEDKADVFVDFYTDQKVDSAFDDVIGAQEAYAARGYRVFGPKAKAAAEQADD